MGWFQELSNLIRPRESSSNIPAEETFVKSLIKGIQRQIKVIENQQKSLIKCKDKLRNKLGVEDKDGRCKLAGYEKENENMNNHLNTLRIKLELVETRLGEIVSYDVGITDAETKKDGGLKS